ncbi:sorting nexin-12 isoform X5 [Nerophis ophidion]|uniref:sorting nexin-12 isoform X5 n=1 Tax=Nerophis ophidion TaxID=159077 RepID=UPI002ADF665E|nr:sorting nexin-12 isoform X5 [Nerophis ophidion]
MQPDKMSEPAVADTRRLNSKPQDLTDAYGPPSNFLEIDVFDPQVVGVGRQRYTIYKVRMRTNLPIFKLKDSCVTRRYSDFEWLKKELERDSKIVVPPLPGKALKRQLPFRSDEGLFEDSFIEERRSGLEQFINKIAGHPLAQNERCLHMFLQEAEIDRNYIPGKTAAPSSCMFISTHFLLKLVETCMSCLWCLSSHVHYSISSFLATHQKLLFCCQDVIMMTTSPK